MQDNLFLWVNFSEIGAVLLTQFRAEVLMGQPGIVFLLRFPPGGEELAEIDVFENIGFCFHDNDTRCQRFRLFTVLI